MTQPLNRVAQESKWNNAVLSATTLHMSRGKFEETIYELPSLTT